MLRRDEVAGEERVVGAGGGRRVQRTAADADPPNIEEEVIDATVTRGKPMFVSDSSDAFLGSCTRRRCLLGYRFQVGFCQVPCGGFLCAPHQS
jgi:hypothetical protein